MRYLVGLMVLFSMVSCYTAPEYQYIESKPYQLPLVGEQVYAFQLHYDVDTTTFGNVASGLDFIYAVDTIDVHLHFESIIIDKVKSHHAYDDMQTAYVIAYQCDKRGAAITPIFSWNEGNGYNTTRGYNFKRGITLY